MAFIPSYVPVHGSSLNAISKRFCIMMYPRWAAYGCGLGCVSLCHLLCARRAFNGIRIVVVTGCREIIIWQRVTSCVYSQIRIVKQAFYISVLSTIICYRPGVCAGEISGYYNLLNSWLVEIISLECAGIGHVQGFRRLPSCEYDEKCRRCNSDGDRDRITERVWTFVTEGQAPGAVVAGPLTYGNLACAWRWRESDKRIKADELADVQSKDGVISDLRGRTILRCIVTALYHIFIMLNVNVENISQPFLAISWALSVIGTALLVLVMSVRDDPLTIKTLF